ncbi:MAG TPA: glycosyltransferase [Nitrososphaeraceae archaeon]|nr:glycosyltransferase [Nitrososphaeraceae archaeon]
MTCRNSEKEIESAIISLLKQTIVPKYVIVVDDGSTDGTSRILEGLKSRNDRLFVITNPDLGYDIGRVVKNWNSAISLARKLNLEITDYHMISADDTLYEESYSEKIMNIMDSDGKIAISSGNYDNNKYSTPHGAGRFVRNSFFEEFLQLYPEKMGYESVILQMSLYHGFKNFVNNDARFSHTRPLGTNHHFYEFGASMRTLGYHPLFVLGRFVQCFLTGRPMGRIGAVQMLYHYLSYSPKQVGYDSMYDPEIRKAIRSRQMTRIMQILRLRNTNV